MSLAIRVPSDQERDFAVRLGLQPLQILGKAARRFSRNPYVCPVVAEGCSCARDKDFYSICFGGKFEYKDCPGYRRWATGEGDSRMFNMTDLLSSGEVSYFHVNGHGSRRFDTGRNDASIQQQIDEGELDLLDIADDGLLGQEEYAMTHPVKAAR